MIIKQYRSRFNLKSKALRYGVIVSLIFCGFINFVRAHNVTEKEQKSMDSLTEAMIKLHESGQLNNPISQKLGEELKQSYHKQQALIKKLKASEEDLAIRKEMQAILKSQVGVKKDDTQAILNRCVRELKLDHVIVYRMMQRGDPRIKRVVDKMIKEENQKLYNKVKANRARRLNHSTVTE